MNPISITVDPTGAYQLANADYEALIAQGALLLSTNPDGTQIRLTLTASVYDPVALATDLNNQITALQAQLAPLQANPAVQAALATLTPANPVQPMPAQ
jgi:hypothetical protein